MRARNDLNSRTSATLDIGYRSYNSYNVNGNVKINGNYQSHEDVEVLKVSAHSRPSAVAGAIAGVIRSQGHTNVQAIGAGATNQAIKAIAIAREYLRPNGIDIVMVPVFIDIQIDDEERTAIRLEIESRPI